ncbi:GtrA family protein [Mesorhizobium sp. ORM6]
MVLTLASLVLLLEAPTHRPAAFFAGICATLTLAIGMESAPYAGALGAVVALLFLGNGDSERLIARDFGLGAAGVSALVFAATIPASAWGQAQCDTFSVVQFALVALAGVGLAVITSWRAANATFARRLVSLGVLAGVLALVVVLLFPQCLAAPYARLDPRLQQMWLGHIEEAQSIFQLVSDDPARAVARFATPLVAIIVMALHFSHGGWRRQDSLVGALLVVAFLVSAWEVRGSTFSIAFAVIPLSAWIAKWRQRAEISPSRDSVFRMAAAWLISVNAIWSGAAQAASSAFEAGAPAQDASIDAPCNSKASFAALGRIAPTTVLAISNLGSPILAFTDHRVFAGPYHRNVAGNLLVLDAMLGSAADAKAIVDSHHVGLVALCRGNPESRLLAARAPGGFLATLMRGGVPDWLGPVAETRGASLELYRVRPNS